MNRFGLPRGEIGRRARRAGISTSAMLKQLGLCHDCGGPSRPGKKV